MSFYKMERGWMESAMFKKSPFTDREAWCWMIEAARWQDGVVPVDGKPLSIKRGQLFVSVRFLASKFSWSKDRVNRFLKRLMRWSAITTDTATGQNLITICNYSKYQDTQVDDKDTNEDVTKDSNKDDPKDKVEEGIKKEKKVKEKVPQFSRPDWIPEQAWNDFIVHRKKLRKPMSSHAMGLTVRELSKLMQTGHAPEEVLNQSIQRGWAGVFELKGGNGNENNHRGRPNGFATNGNKHERAKAALRQSAIDLGYADGGRTWPEETN